MIYPNNFRFGLVVRVEGQLFSIAGFQHVKPGKGGAYVRTKLKRLSDGNVIERTFRSEEKIEDVRLEGRDMQYLYKDGNLLYFMDKDTYEQTPLGADYLGDAVNYIAEGSIIKVQFLEHEPITVDLPPAVVLNVTQTDPGLKGDTATGGTKPATMETGLVLQVPLFVEEGDAIKVDTRSGEYLERA